MLTFLALGSRPAGTLALPATTLLTSLEVVALMRDIILIIFLVLAFLVLFVFSLLGVLLYRRVSRVLDRAERTLANTEVMTGMLADGINSVSQLAGILSVRSLGSLASRFFGRGREK